ncbi:competence protein ComFC [Ruminococcus sp. YE71]|nr:competence protein ComFC [Ruminococcus sp. YE78]SFW40723.1 competence protein ComFC [Ruminococcus sp. YE71]
MKLTMKRFSELILDVFFPNQCVACNKAVPMDMVFCEECAAKLEYLPETPWQAMFPPEINGAHPSFDYANALFFYDGTAREAVLNFKDKAALSLAAYSAERLVLKLESDGFDRIDLVTSVPMHRSKRLERGYDQARVFAEAMAEQLNVPYDGTLLGRRRSRMAQHERGMSERFASADKTYFLTDPARTLEGKRILICDDIFTTGATLDKCASLLKKSAAEKVGVLTICLTDSFGRGESAGRLGGDPFEKGSSPKPPH